MPSPKSKWEMVGLAFDLGFIIALPLLVLSQLGKYLDQRWGTHPFFILVGITLAMTSSGFWLYHHLKPYLK